MGKRTDADRWNRFESLSGLVNLIETDWLIQPSGAWNGDSVDKLTRHLHELCESGKPVDQRALQMLGKLVEEMIQGGIDRDSISDRDRLTSLKESLERLESRIEPLQLSASHPSADSEGVDLLLIHRHQSVWHQIERALELRNWRYRTVSDLQDVSNVLGGEEKVVLVDTSFLPEFDRQIPEINHHRRQSRPHLFFVSDRCDIKIQMQALRAGGMKLFSEPINTDALLEALEDYIHPKRAPHQRVLVVEGYMAQANQVTELLQKAAFETHVLSDPSEVIDAIWGFRPDIILLMDLYSTSADGLVLTRLIRDREESTAIPIVFVSEVEDADKRLQALQAGADDYLIVSSQLNQLVTTVRSRIDRVEAISASGVKRSGGASVELGDREGFLLRLEQANHDQGSEGWLYGLIVISFDFSDAESDYWIGAETEQQIDVVAEELQPLLQGRDFLARIGPSSLAGLVRRPSTQELKRVADMVYEMVNYRFSSMTTKAVRIGIGLSIFDSESQGADVLLHQGEMAASVAGMRARKGCYLYEKGRDDLYLMVNEQNGWNKEVFLGTLKDGAATLEERRYVCRKERARSTEIIELIPRIELPDGYEDLYQAAAKYGAVSECDQFVCNLGIQRLCEYNLQGKAVRLILRQSAAVFEQSDYLEFVKSALRRLHIVGTGLMIEFSLTSLVSHLQQAHALFGELSALGIAISLSHFPCNRSGYKVLTHLRADAVRPHLSMLQDESDPIEQISEQIRSLQTEIILPSVDDVTQIPRSWWESADYVQADFQMNKPASGDMGENSLSTYPGHQRGGVSFANETHKPQGSEVSGISGV
jgi:PleD family two-component response regulator/EAL domain-containing protein (putative c-di-GMP-specific phosphodiesterase class I)